MELSHSTQDLPSILWNPKVHYRLHKSLPLVPILSHIDQVHTTPSYLSKIHFNIDHPHSLLSSCHEGGPLVPGGGVKRQGFEADYSLHLVPRSRMMELYLHFHTCLHGNRLSKLNTWVTLNLPFSYLRVYTVVFCAVTVCSLLVGDLDDAANIIFRNTRL
jgi:hypothetical protein